MTQYLSEEDTALRPRAEQLMASGMSARKVAKELGIGRPRLDRVLDETILNAPQPEEKGNEMTAPNEYPTDDEYIEGDGEGDDEEIGLDSPDELEPAVWPTGREINVIIQGVGVITSDKPGNKGKMWFKCDLIARADQADLDLEELAGTALEIFYQ